MPSPAPKGEKPSGVRIDWKLRAQRLERNLNSASVTIDVVQKVSDDRLEIINDKDRSIRNLRENIALLKGKCFDHELEHIKLTKVLEGRDETIANSQSYQDELLGKIRELEGEIEDAAKQADRALNLKEAQNASERIRWRADGEYYRATIEAYKQEISRIPRWLRVLFGVPSYVGEGKK